MPWRADSALGRLRLGGGAEWLRRGRCARLQLADARAAIGAGRREVEAGRAGRLPQIGSTRREPFARIPPATRYPNNRTASEQHRPPIAPKGC